ncbi:MAG: hypothetical protein ABFS21_01990 [Actinomycetota bacterium]
MEIRRARYNDLDDIEAVARWACAAAIGELVPETAVSGCAQKRFRRALLSEHMLAQRLLVGQSENGQIELVVLIDEYLDHTELATVVVPAHPSRTIDGRGLVTTLRTMGWLGALRSSVALGDVAGEHFHETAGFAPGDAVVEEIGGYSIVRREWWLDPALSATG